MLATACEDKLSTGSDWTQQSLGIWLENQAAEQMASEEPSAAEQLAALTAEADQPIVMAVCVCFCGLP